jgi:hypothetical protein
VLAWATIPLGLALIGLAVLDVFLTVLHIQVESPISNKVNRRLWSIVVGLSRALPERSRGEILGWGAPLMVGGILVFWSVLYIVGFALLYLPFVRNAAVFSFSGTSPGSDLNDALYFSATSFFTTGFGDIVPVHPIARLLAILQGGLGLTTLSLSVTYLLSVYPLIGRKMSLAAALNQETGGRADAVILAQRYVCSGRYEALAQRLSGINDELLKLGQSHGLYPVLYFVRPREVHHSFVRVLVVIQGIVATLRYGIDPDTYPDVVSDPRLLILEEGLLSTLHTLAESSHLAPSVTNGQDDRALDQHFPALVEALRAHGVAAVALDDDEAHNRHTRFRTATDRYIRAYAVNAGYDFEEARASYSRWDRDTALVGQAEVKQGVAPGVTANAADDPDGSGHAAADPDWTVHPAAARSLPPSPAHDSRGT